MFVGKPVFVPELGVLMLKPGALLPMLQRRLGKDMVLLSPADKGEAKQAGWHEPKASPLSAHYDELCQWVKTEPVLTALGGDVGWVNWCKADGCLFSEQDGDDECCGDLTFSADSAGLPLPFCWHHDAQFRKGHMGDVSPLVDRSRVNWLLAQAAKLNGTRVSYMRLADLLAWACAKQLQLPGGIARALFNANHETSRHAGAGYKDTDARYQADPLDGIIKTIKKITLPVDPEPAELFMHRPKEKRFESAAYLNFVRALPCVVSGQPNSQAHHLIGHGHSGMALKVHDFLAFPLSPEAHKELHDIGWQAWEQKHGSQHQHIINTLSKACGLGVFNRG
ncbi:DUF968 domain-containing protein [Motilimonas cestriensis]|uniref:DUF968 domain-containing protein n=1 Tax=Motilimonas cestriensis TaxID=2742685 RepID=UPI003DA5AC20